MKIKRNSQKNNSYLKDLFGLMPDNVEIYFYELSNKNGMKLKVITYGATVTELKMPLKNGDIVDVVLGFDTLDGYLKSFELESPPYMGTIVGRFAGRIDNSTFNLNGQKIFLNKNNNDNSLHGGLIGFSQKIWSVDEVIQGDNSTISFYYMSPSNEENYPGDLAVEVTYTLSETNELIIEYKATTTEDTVVNLTSHNYFNLNGHLADVKDQELIVNARQMLEKNTENIPTGNYLELENLPFDFSAPKKCPTEIDTTFVLSQKNEFAASLFNKNNNLKMTVYTDQPGVHIYVGGNCFNEIKGKENANYHSVSGICFEAQNFPDAPNHNHFPSAVLKKGDEYVQTTIYKFQSF